MFATRKTATWNPGHWHQGTLALAAFEMSAITLRISS